LDHQIALLDKLKTREERLWYAPKAIEHNRSPNILVMQIENALMKHVTDFMLELGAGFAFAGRQVLSMWARRSFSSPCSFTI
jgi:predicted nuclease of restriction endonuclease-like (RecB) superfamily